MSSFRKLRRGIRGALKVGNGPTGAIFISGGEPTFAALNTIDS